MTPPRDPEDVLKELEAQAREDAAAEAEEVRALAAMSDADLDAELAEAGIQPDDVARMAETARARAAEAKGAGAVAVAVEQDAPRLVADRVAPAVAPGKRRRGALPLWLAAAAVATVGAGALVYALTQPSTPSPEPTAPPLPPREPPESRDLVAAADLRREAAVACNAGHYDECLRLLDEAKQKDPLGDRAKVVVEMRQRARAVLEVDGGKK